MPTTARGIRFRLAAGSFGLLLLLCLARLSASASVSREFAPSFSLKSLTGTTFCLTEDLREHPVFVAFIGTHCSPCEESLPALERLFETYGRGGKLHFVCIAVDPELAARKFLDSGRFKCRADLLLDEVTDGRYITATSYGVMGTPTFFLVGKDGRVLWRHVGRLVSAQAEEAISSALGGFRSAPEANPLDSSRSHRQDDGGGEWSSNAQNSSSSPVERPTSRERSEAQERF